MTRVVGKQPLKLHHDPKVSTTYDDKIRIETGGSDGKQLFKAFGDLSPGCASVLILELRKALRRVRDERVRYLNSQVSDAEKPL